MLHKLMFVKVIGTEGPSLETIILVLRVIAHSLQKSIMITKMPGQKTNLPLGQLKLMRTNPWI